MKFIRDVTGSEKMTQMLLTKDLHAVALSHDHA